MTTPPPKPPSAESAPDHVPLAYRDHDFLDFVRAGDERRLRRPRDAVPARLAAGAFRPALAQPYPSRAIRIVGDQVETSFAKANALWKQARDTVTFTVKEYADTAVALVKQTLPGTSPKRVTAVRKAVRSRKAVRVAFHRGLHSEAGACFPGTSC